MSQTNLSDQDQKVVKSKSALNALETEINSFRKHLAEFKQASELASSLKSSAKNVFNKYFSWEYNLNELEFE